MKTLLSTDFWFWLAVLCLAVVIYAVLGFQPTPSPTSTMPAALENANRVYSLGLYYASRVSILVAGGFVIAGWWRARDEARYL
jgi:hypothetical protein